MSNNSRDNMLYIEGDKPPRKKKYRVRLKLFNLFMLFAVSYFVLTTVKQEFMLRDIKAQTVAANQEYAELKQQEGVINKKIADASSTHMVENKAKSILGWVNENEFKVIEQK